MNRVISLRVIVPRANANQLSMSTYPLLYTFVHFSPSFPGCPGLQLADEETGGEEAHALGQDVLGEDVDERWQQDEGHGGLIDEEERDQLGHGRLEHRLLPRISHRSLHRQSATSWAHHLLCANFGLLVLARNQGRARHNRWADDGGRAESGPREGAEEAGVHAGLSGVAGQRAAAGVQLALWSLREGD